MSANKTHTTFSGVGTPQLLTSISPPSGHHAAPHGHRARADSDHAHSDGENTRSVSGAGEKGGVGEGHDANMDGDAGAGLNNELVLSG